MATVTGRASSSRITIRGGRKLARFLEKASGLTPERLAALMARVLSRTMLPALRTLVPSRTGRLKRSLKIIQRGADIELRAIFYGRLVPIGTARDSLAEVAIDWLNENRVIIKAQLRLEVRKELGI